MRCKLRPPGWKSDRLHTIYLPDFHSILYSAFAYLKGTVLPTIWILYSSTYIPRDPELCQKWICNTHPSTVWLSRFPWEKQYLIHSWCCEANQHYKTVVTVYCTVLFGRSFLWFQNVQLNPKWIWEKLTRTPWYFLFVCVSVWNGHENGLSRTGNDDRGMMLLHKTHFPPVMILMHTWRKVCSESSSFEVLTHRLETGRKMGPYLNLIRLNIIWTWADLDSRLSLNYEEPSGPSKPLCCKYDGDFL